MSSIGGLSDGSLACIGDTITECCEPVNECCNEPFVDLASTGANAPAPTITGSATLELSASYSSGGNGVSTSTTTQDVAPTVLVLPDQITSSSCGESHWVRQGLGPTQPLGGSGINQYLNQEILNIDTLLYGPIIRVTFAAQSGTENGATATLVEARVFSFVNVNLLTGQAEVSGAITAIGENGITAVTGGDLTVDSQAISLDGSGNGTISLTLSGNFNQSGSATISASASININLTIADLINCNPPPPPVPFCCNFGQVPASCGPVNPIDGKLQGSVSFSMVYRLQRGKESAFSSCPPTTQLRMINDAGIVTFNTNPVNTNPACQIWEPPNILDQNNITEFAIDGYSGCEGIDTQTDTSRHFVSFAQATPGPAFAPLGVRNDYQGFTGVGMQYESNIFGGTNEANLLLRAVHYNGVPQFFIRHLGTPQVTGVIGESTDPAQPFVTIPIDAGTNQGKGTKLIWPTGINVNTRRIEYDIQFFPITSQTLDGTPPPCGDNLRRLSVIGSIRIFIGSNHSLASLRDQLTHDIVFALEYDTTTPFAACPEGGSFPVREGGCSGCNDGGTGGLLL